MKQLWNTRKFKCNYCVWEVITLRLCDTICRNGKNVEKADLEVAQNMLFLINLINLYIINVFTLK